MKVFVVFARKWFWWPLTALLVVTLYFILLRRVVGSHTAARIELVVLGILVFSFVGLLLAVLFTLARMALAENRAAWMKTIGDQLVILLCVLVLLFGLVLGSQWMAHTPAIQGSDGQPLPGSIAALEKVKLGGVDQWLIVRGYDTRKPVLLFLSGGPGSSEAARVLRFNSELEKHFVVVIWEQRGCGKSYPSFNPKSKLTVDQYVADIIELTELLRARFGEEKIYLVGHSWGTVIGVRAAQVRPDLFHAYIGASQMVDVLETDQVIYDLVLDHARKTGDAAFIKTMEAQGQPPYTGSNPVRPYAALFGREYAVFEVPNIKDEAYRRDGDILLLMLKQPEYGWLDRINNLLGLMNTFNVVYPQLQEMDFRHDATRFDLPIYIVLGRYDMNNPSQIPEEYFNLLEAPKKDLIFFENSGHGMIWEEASLFHRLMIETVLPETYPK